MHFRRWFGVPAFVSGVLLLLAPVLYGVRSLQSSTSFDYLVFASPLLLIVGLYGFHREHGSAYTWKADVGTWLVAGGLLGIVPMLAHRTVTQYTLPTAVPLMVLAMVGIVLLEAGTIGIGIDAWRTETPSKRLAVGLPLSLPVSAIANGLFGPIGAEIITLPFWFGLHWYGGLFGLAWIGIGYYALRPTRARTKALF